MASILSEQGYLGQGRFDPDGAQQYINNLAGAPGGPSAMAVHNRAMNIVVNGASDRFPDGTEAYYARAYRQTFEAENIRDPSAAQRYIDNLDAAFVMIGKDGDAPFSRPWNEPPCEHASADRSENEAAPKGVHQLRPCDLHIRDERYVTHIGLIDRTVP